MAAFASGEADVLVATTVIEVGIDVPNATVMVIENAERFGISQLHQLRGRIGRGEHRSVCLLMAALGLAAGCARWQSTPTASRWPRSTCGCARRASWSGTRQSGLGQFQMATPAGGRAAAGARAGMRRGDRRGATRSCAAPEHALLGEELERGSASQALEPIRPARG